MAAQGRTLIAMTAGFVFSAGAVNALAHNESIAGMPRTEGPAQDVLLSLETSAYEAWKSKNATFWGSFLSDKFVGWGASGRLDKASAIQQYTGADCNVESVAISDPQLTPLGRDAALITHKTAVAGTCAGQKMPGVSWSATAYVRDGNQWKAAFHAEAAIVDPAAVPSKPAVQNPRGERRHITSADRDARTDVLLPLEIAIWDAWKDHDSTRLDHLTATNMQFINIFGVHLATKTDALKNWSGEGCDVKTISLTDPTATMLSPTVGILTFHASADGTCFGQKVGPIWGSSIYVKDGNAWKWNFGINLPAAITKPDQS
jgi:hypothetical protein